MNLCLRKQNVVQQVFGSSEGALCGLSRHWHSAILGMVIVLTGVACAGAQTSEWVWMGGSQTAGAVGVYGTQGSAATGNIPGARQNAFTWTDASGNLWLFGGTGKDSAGTQGELNDLWEFNSSTNEWTWVSGSKTANAAATCGTPGAWSATYIPGPRDSGVAWADKSGNLWLFGGNGYDCGGKQGLLNDLWEYSPSNQEWTLVSGSESANSNGNYGTQGGALSTNVPGAREGKIVEGLFRDGQTVMGISGSLAARDTILLVQWIASTTSGNTALLPVCGRGSAAVKRSMAQAYTGLKG